MHAEIATSPNVEARANEISASAMPSPTKEEVLARVATIGSELRKLVLEIKKFPRDKTLEPHNDELRCLAQAQTQLQVGMMWLRRSITPTKEF